MNIPTIHAYIRVSTTGQTTDNQRQAILAQGHKPDHWHTEEGVSGTIPALQRPAFAAMQASVKEGDVVIVTMIDRLGRDAEDILHTINRFKDRKISLRITQFDGVDVTSSTGKMICTVMSGMAELERNILAERTKAGLARTKAQGTLLGRPLVIGPDALTKMVADSKAGVTLDSMSREYGFPRKTIQRNVVKWGNSLTGYAAEYAARNAQYAAA